MTTTELPIYMALGANLISRRFGSIRGTFDWALRDLETYGVAVKERSSIWRSPPQPFSEQPWYENALVCLDSKMESEALLLAMHEVEQKAGRTRPQPNAARTLDLDLIDYRGQVLGPGQSEIGLRLPHPRLGERCFVLMPLAELDPGWQHPETGKSVKELIAALPKSPCQRLEMPW